MEEKNVLRGKTPFDFLTAFLMLPALAVVFIKLPHEVADMFFLLNIAIGVMSLFLSLVIFRPENSLFFPRFYYVGTFYRLALCLALFRLIILDSHRGTRGVGHIVVTSGEISMAGDLVVYFILFLIIMFIAILFIWTGIAKIRNCCAFACEFISGIPEEYKFRNFYENIVGVTGFMIGESVSIILLSLTAF